MLQKTKMQPIFGQELSIKGKLLPSFVMEFRSNIDAKIAHWVYVYERQYIKEYDIYVLLDPGPLGCSEKELKNRFDMWAIKYIEEEV
jgi:hypothetical protein